MINKSQLGALQSGAPGDLTSGGGAAPEHSTQFQFTTIVEDLTTSWGFLQTVMVVINEFTL